MENGPRVKYGDYEGNIDDSFSVIIDALDNHSIIGRILAENGWSGKLQVKVRFDKRWHWNMTEDNILLVDFFKLKRIYKRIFNDNDPFGEEDWYN